MDKITFLTSFLGNGQRANRDYYQFHCPFCGHHKPKLGIALNTGKWRCWTCPSRGHTVQTLLRKLRLTHEHLRQTANSLWPVSDVRTEQLPKNQPVVSLPDGYTPAWQHSHKFEYFRARGFLKSRGVTELDVCKHRIGYCERGKCSNMVVFPSYNTHGSLNYYNARTFVDSVYKFSDPVDVSKNVILDENLINWHEPVVLVEGRLDAVAVKRNAVPLCGKTISSALRQKILDEGTPEIIFCLDGDALMDAMRNCGYFVKNGVKVKIAKLPVGQDPNSLGFPLVWEYIENAVELNEQDIFRHNFITKLNKASTKLF